jgi:anti-anti-sigma factor
MGMTRFNENDKLVCKFDGSMDTLACKELENDFSVVLSDCENDKVSLEMDLSGVDYIASSFLRLCGKAAQQLTVENVAIINVTPQVKKVFKIAGLADRLNIS